MEITSAAHKDSQDTFVDGWARCAPCWQHCMHCTTSWLCWPHGKRVTLAHVTWYATVLQAAPLSTKSCMMSTTLADSRAGCDRSEQREECQRQLQQYVKMDQGAGLSEENSKVCPSPTTLLLAPCRPAAHCCAHHAASVSTSLPRPTCLGLL